MYEYLRNNTKLWARYGAVNYRPALLTPGWVITQVLGIERILAPHRNTCSNRASRNPPYLMAHVDKVIRPIYYVLIFKKSVRK